MIKNNCKYGQFFREKNTTNWSKYSNSKAAADIKIFDAQIAKTPYFCPTETVFNGLYFDIDAPKYVTDTFQEIILLFWRDSINY